MGVQAATKTGATTSAYLNASIYVHQAALWSIPRPFLYTLMSEVVDAAGTVVDVVNTTVGVRTLNYTGDHGFFMNDKHVKVLTE